MDKDTPSAMNFGVEHLRCPLCTFELTIAVPSYVTPDQTLMNQLAAGSQRKMADAMASHLKQEHGLISILMHQWELNAQADKSFKEGVREGETHLDTRLRKVVIEAVREGVNISSFMDDE